MYNSPLRDVGMASPAGARPLPGSAMNPPPIPSHLSRPPQLKARTESTSPSKLNPVGFSTQRTNPYGPRGSDATSGGGNNTQWADYRPPANRVASGGSAHSPMSGALSPYSHDNLSPNSPMMNPYEGASPVGHFEHNLLPTHGTQMPVSPMQHPSWGEASPVSPHKAPPNIRSQSHQQFPYSQSANSSLQSQHDASMRGSSRGSSMQGSSREGLREVKAASDLKPVVNTHSNGRRADPTKSGKYLSVS
jgi:hypothetical protein